MAKKNITEKLAKTLQIVLANTYVLYVKTQNFHWNVVDPNFLPLHKMFEGQYEELAEAIDLIAERIRFFGFRAPGSLKEFLNLSTLAESTTKLSGPEMIKKLYEDHEPLGLFSTSSIKEAQELGDEATADIYIERLRAHNKTAWILKSHV